ncbi:Spt20 family domain containing protein [Rhypophila decipiens]
MAPTVTAAVPPAPVTGKIKRPIPPGIQTNGVVVGGAAARSSPSPSMSAKRPPSAVRQPSNPPTANGMTPSSARPPNRLRKDGPGQVLGRGQRSAGLRSASIVPDFASSPAVEAPPYVVTDSYILKKYAGNPPSLILHLHPTHFRFDAQEGMFPYKSPMRIFLDHLRHRTIPHEMMEYFTQWGVPFYEGCLIVQVHDHKSSAQVKDVQKPTSTASKTVPFSIHNYNQYLTPSPYVPFPKEEQTNGDAPSAEDANKAEKTAEEIDKENMPAPSVPTEAQKSKGPPKVKISTIVLHPTQQTLQADLAIKASTPRGASDSRTDGLGPPPTPSLAVPPTPTAASMPPPSKRQKREHMELEGSHIYAAEAQILLATTAPLDLEPTKSAEETLAKLEKLQHPEHAHKPPEPKTRKRTVAEVQADEAFAAEQERYMLALDERISPKAAGNQGGANGTDGDVQAGGNAWEPRFDRWALIVDIRREQAEKREQEKIKQAEESQRLALQKKQQEQQAAQLAMQQQQRAREEQERQVKERAAAALRERQEQQRRMHQAQQQQAQAQAQQQAQHQAQAQAQAQHQAQQQAAAQAQHQAQQQAAAQAQHQAQAQAHAHAQAQAQAQAQQQAQNSPLPTSMAGLPVSMASQAQVRLAQNSQPPVSSPIVRQNTPQTASSPMVPGVAMQHSNSNMGGSPQRPPSVVQNHPPMSAPMAPSMSARGSQQSHQGGTPRVRTATPNMAHATPNTRPGAVQTPRMTQASPPPNMITAQQVGQAMLMNNQAMGQMPPGGGFSAASAQQIAAHQRMLQQRQQLAHMQQNGMMVPGAQNMTAAQQQHMMQQRMLQQHLLQQQQQRGQMGGQPGQPGLNQLSATYQQNLNNMQATMQQQQQASQMQRIAAAQQAAQAQGVMNLTPQQQQLLAMQQQQIQQQLQVQAQAQAQAQAQQIQQQQQQMRMAGNNAQFQAQAQAHSQALFSKNLPKFVEQYGGLANVPAEAMDTFRKNCNVQAREAVLRAHQARLQQAQAQAQMQQAQAQAQANGMQAMMHSMG